MSKSLIAALIFVALGLYSSDLSAHCEIPCGIYDDPMRVALLREHIDTIEKSMKMIRSISSEEPVDYNQLVRWIDNKESHADMLQHIVTQYFMTQRVKPSSAEGSGDEVYEGQLTALHRLLIASMKAKQTTELQYIEEMRKLVDTFEKLYFNK